MPDAPAPSFEIILGTSAMGEDRAKQVHEIVVRKHLGRAATFVVRMSDPDEDLADAKDFTFGKAVEIKLGYVEEVESVFKGEITAWMARYSRRGTEFVFRGMDKSHRLRRSRAHAQLKATKDSDAPAELVEGTDLSPKVDKTSATHPPLQLMGVSPHDFLAERARRLGYRLGADGDTLSFTKPTYKSSKHTAVWDENILALDLVVELSDMPSEAQVRGWDPKKKEAFEKTVTSDDLLWPQGDATAGPAFSKKLFGNATAILHDVAPTSEAEAEAIAKAYLQGRAEGFVRGPLTVRGAPKLIPGTTLTLSKVPTPMAGSYLIHGVTHFYNETGFNTRLELARAGL